MLEFIKVIGYEQLMVELDRLDAEDCQRQIYVYLTSKKTSKDRTISWCESCDQAESVVYHLAFEMAENDPIFIRCETGSRKEWEAEDNQFLKQPRFQFDEEEIRMQEQPLPVLFQYRTDHKVICDSCVNPDYVEIFFNEAW